MAKRDMAATVVREFDFSVDANGKVTRQGLDMGEISASGTFLPSDDISPDEANEIKRNLIDVGIH